MLSELPDSSVSLILTDSPYHSTGKSNISGDRSFEEDEHFLGWAEPALEALTARHETFPSHLMRLVDFDDVWRKGGR
jgi:hypothetical protein